LGPKLASTKPVGDNTTGLVHAVHVPSDDDSRVRDKETIPEPESENAVVDPTMSFLDEIVVQAPPEVPLTPSTMSVPFVGGVVSTFTVVISDVEFPTASLVENVYR
jgi:hypothetical protein